MELKGLKRLIPYRLRRAYRRYLSPIIRDEYYFQNRGRREFFRTACAALALNGIEGDYAEFGCCGGVTFALAHKYLRKYGLKAHLWAFDSFQGLPEAATQEDEHPIWVAGTMKMSQQEFNRSCAERGIPRNCYSIVEGYYEKSLLAPGADAAARDICLAYVDCDMYSSAKTVLQFLEKRLKHGMILAFDDYYCWSSTQAPGERKACAEIFQDHPTWVLVPFLRFSVCGMAFVVEARALGARSGAEY